MSKYILCLIGSLFMAGNLALATAPEVSNVRVSQRTGTKLVDIYYDLVKSDGGTCHVQVEISLDGGQGWRAPATTFTGAVGTNVTPGNNKLITWNAGTDFDGNFADNCKARVFASDSAYPEPPTGMVYIPAGTFQMGDNLDAMTDAPVTFIDLSAFFIDQTETSSQLYQQVREWANSNGYDLPGLISLGAGHPQGYISWFTAVKFANARSEYENLTPCYYSDVEQASIYRSGEADLLPANVMWGADGYRLPTEAEWEKASRGSYAGKRFPWGTDIIDHSLANYTTTLYDPYEGDPNATYGESRHPDVTSANPYTLPVSHFQANEYGIYDMAGNLREWCWERYSSMTYGMDITDPVEWGSTNFSSRVIRGGTAASRASDLRCAYRDQDSPDSNFSSYSDKDDIGFRLVRSAP